MTSCHNKEQVYDGYARVCGGQSQCTAVGGRWSKRMCKYGARVPKAVARLMLSSRYGAFLWGLVWRVYYCTDSIQATHRLFTSMITPLSTQANAIDPGTRLKACKKLVLITPYMGTDTYSVGQGRRRTSLERH